MTNVIDQPATSAKPQTPDQSASVNNVGANQSASPTRPPRLTSLSGLLLRENVEFVIVTGAAKMKLQIEGDSKTFDMGDDAEGCFVVMRLKDNPARVGDKFYEVKPPRPSLSG